MILHYGRIEHLSSKPLSIVLPVTGSPCCLSFAKRVDICAHQDLHLLWSILTDLFIEVPVFGFPSTSNKNRFKALHINCRLPPLLGLSTFQPRTASTYLSTPTGPANSFSLPWTAGISGPGDSSLQTPGALGKSPTSHFPRLG